MTVDYYSMSLAGPFGREAATCACADLVTNDAGQVNKIVTELINGEDIETDGIDIEVDCHSWDSEGQVHWASHRKERHS